MARSITLCGGETSNRLLDWQVNCYALLGKIRTSSSLVSLAAVGDFYYGDGLLLLDDPIDNPVIADAKTILPGQCSLKLFNVGMLARVVFQLLKAPSQLPRKRLVRLPIERLRFG